MRIFVVPLATVCSLALAPALLADPKPKEAKSANPQTVANFYAGNSHNWKSCKGGIHYGPNWEAVAYCNKNGPSVGIGKREVDSKGRVCHQLTWYWPEGKKVGSKPDDKKNCISHLVDSDGKIWRNWDGDAEWWGTGLSRKRTQGTVKGNPFKSKINRLRKKLNV